MKYLFSIISIIFSLTIQGAKADQPRLLFSSGFEKGVQLGPLIDGYQKITGTDAQTGFNRVLLALEQRRRRAGALEGERENHW